MLSIRLLIVFFAVGFVTVSAQAPFSARILWTVEGGLNPEYEFVNMSAADDRALYTVLPGKTWDYSTENGNFRETGSTVAALDLSTGRVIWSAESRWPVLSPLLLADGRLVAHNGYGEIHCFDAVSGSLLWKVEPELHPGGWDERTMPAGEGDFLYLREENDLVCRNAKNGLQVWRTPVDAVRNMRIYPALCAGRVFISDGMDSVTAFDAGSGRLLWKKRLPAVREVVAASSSAVFVYDDGRGYALAAENGKTIRVFGLPWGGGGAAGPGAQGTKVLAVLGGNVFLVRERVVFPEGSVVAQEVACVELATGLEVWSRTVGNGFQGMSLTGAFAVSVEGGKIVARDVDTGRTAWEFEMPGTDRLQGQPLAVAGKIVVSGLKGLVCIETGDAGIADWMQSGGSARRAYRWR